MTRILFFILIVVAAALCLAWLADRPGTVMIEWLGYQIEASAFVVTLMIAVLVAALILLFEFVRYLWTRPAAVTAYMRERRRQQGLEALSRGLVAVGVGDRQLAQRYAGIAGRNLPREPLTALLRAQAAQLKGDRDAAQRAFQKMLDEPETHLLGVRGLFLEAQRRDEPEVAQALARQAVERDPRLAWSVNALFDIQARAGDWEGAMDTLAIARHNGHVDSKTADRRRAVLLTAKARELEPFKPDKAYKLVNEALRLAPSLVPAGELAGRLLASRGETRAASRLIAKTWKLSPHPDLAIAYGFAKPGLSPRDRLKRVEYLATLTPGDIEGPIAVAQAAIEAHAWQEARHALAPHLDGRPSARICALMAQIEAGDGDKGREREWLARAVRAPKDRAWIADGYVSDRWLPISPITGAVDAFEWKAPMDAIGRGDDKLLLEEEPEAPALVSEPSGEEPPDHEPGVVVDVTPVAHEEAQPKKQAQPAGEPAPSAQGKPDSSGFIPVRPPDDPGVSKPDPDESPTSLERLRAAHIR